MWLSRSVCQHTHIVSEIFGDRAVICYDNIVVAAVNVDDLTLASAESSTSTPTAPNIKVGSTVTLRRGSKTFDGGKLAAFVYDRPHIVSELVGERAVITFDGKVVAAVNVNDLTLA